MKRKDINNPETWKVKLNNSLHQVIYEYMDKHGLKKQDMAKKLNISKSAMSQLLKSDGNHSISKIVELSMYFNKVPIITFVDLNEYIKIEEK